MPEFLEKKLKKEYGDNDHAIYGTMNKLGLMRGNKETAKGRAEEKKHLTKTKAIEHMKSGARKHGMRVKGSDKMTYLGK